MPSLPGPSEKKPVMVKRSFWAPSGSVMRARRTLSVPVKPGSVVVVVLVVVVVVAPGSDVVVVVGLPTSPCGSL